MANIRTSSGSYVSRRRSDAVHWPEATALAALALLIYLFWNTPVVYPMKILVVFFHEMSHGIAAWMTGGRVEAIQVNQMAGGLCVTRGGSRLVILNAGYLGSLLWGGAMLLWASRPRKHSGMTVVLGVILLTVSLWFVRPVASFGFIFGVLTSICLMLTGLRLSERVNEYVLKLIGLTSCFYVALDILADTIVRPDLPSDAVLLAEHTGMPAILWGAAWFVISVTASLYFLRVACQPLSR